MDIEVEGLDTLPDVAGQVLAEAGEHRVFLLYGEMGAGKTTFVKAMCQRLGVKDETSSPTFAIINEYTAPDGPVYHFDFYRIRSEHEALDMGYEEYFYSGAYCFVEWPERIPGLLPADAVTIGISIYPDGRRKFTVDIPNQ
jgi:ATPase, YjeE family